MLLPHRHALGLNTTLLVGLVGSLDVHDCKTQPRNGVLSVSVHSVLGE
jgi:hypothetical protein